jgi:hypothetical protein
MAQPAKIVDSSGLKGASKDARRHQNTLIAAWTRAAHKKAEPPPSKGKVTESKKQASKS